MADRIDLDAVRALVKRLGHPWAADIDDPQDPAREMWTGKWDIGSGDAAGTWSPGEYERRVEAGLARDVASAINLMPALIEMAERADDLGLALVRILEVSNGSEEEFAAFCHAREVIGDVEYDRHRERIPNLPPLPDPDEPVTTEVAGG